MGKEHIEWVFDDAKATIIERGTERDQPDGERTIPRCVAAFNAITGHNLSNTDGWAFMQILKMCRSAQGSYKYDDYRDGVGYAALRAEEARMENEATSDAAVYPCRCEGCRGKPPPDDSSVKGFAKCECGKCEEKIGGVFVPPECDDRIMDVPRAVELVVEHDKKARARYNDHSRCTCGCGADRGDPCKYV